MEGLSRIPENYDSTRLVPIQIDRDPAASSPEIFLEKDQNIG